MRPRGAGAKGAGVDSAADRRFQRVVFRHEPFQSDLVHAADDAGRLLLVAHALGEGERRGHDVEQAEPSAWVLVEDDGDIVVVTVRDDGVGMAAGRMERAAAEGRLGLAVSVRGRIRELGGTVIVTSRPGAGTEVELRVPR